MHRIILFLIRYKHQSNLPPRLGLKLTAEQDAAITALHAFVYATDPFAHEEVDIEYDNRLDQLLHQLLEALFYQKLRLTDFFGCPTDVALVLLCLNEDGSFSKSSRLTFLGAVLQYFARATVTHSLRLHAGGHSHYVPLTTTDDCGIIEDDDVIIQDNDESFMK